MCIILTMQVTSTHPLPTWRLKAGLSQAALAERVGVTQSRLSDWERGHGAPSLDRAIALDELSRGAVPIETWGFTLDALTGAAKVLARRRRGKAVAP